MLRFWSCQTDSISPVHNKRLRALMGPGHRDVACSRHRHCCISTNAIHLLAAHTGLFVMPLTRFPHESLASLSLPLTLCRAGLWHGEERRLVEMRERDRKSA